MSLNYVDSFDLFGVKARQKACKPGSGAPTTTTEGAVGDLYMDTTTGDIYKCTGAKDGQYTWEPSAEGAVLYTVQTLTEEQKAQARANIGALGAEDNVEIVPLNLTFDHYGYLHANEAHPTMFGNNYGNSTLYGMNSYEPCGNAKQLNLLTCYRENQNQHFGLVFYDADKSPIVGHMFPIRTAGAYDATYDIPENAVYFRTCIHREYSAEFYANLIYEQNIVKDLEDEINRAKAAESAIEARFNLADKKVLILGDSISTGNTSTGINYGNYEKWVDKLIEQGFFSADKVTNDSIHATGFLASLSGDSTDCFLPRLQAVQNPGEYDIVIVFGGINDFIKAKPYADFTVAVDAFFEYLTNTFVNARICILRPFRTSSQSGVGNYNQTHYSEYIGTVAKSYCLPVLNLTEESGFYPWIPAFKNRWTFTGWTGGDGTTGDGVHPNEE